MDYKIRHLAALSQNETILIKKLKTYERDSKIEKEVIMETEAQDGEIEAQKNISTILGKKRKLFEQLHEVLDIKVEVATTQEETIKNYERDSDIKKEVIKETETQDGAIKAQEDISTFLENKRKLAEQLHDVLDIKVEIKEEEQNEEGASTPKVQRYSLDVIYPSPQPFSSLEGKVREATLNGVKNMGFSIMSTFQAKAIPHLLEGRDLVGVTERETEKTLAFLIPAIEHIYESMPSYTTRCIILAPMKKHALMIFGVMKALMKYHCLTYCLLLERCKKETEERILSVGIDMIVATPGRLLHHLISTPGFSCKNLQCLIIDKADVMLSKRFNEVKQIINLLPARRQTMLFTAQRAKNIEALTALAVTGEPVYVGWDDHPEKATEAPELRLEEAGSAEHEWQWLKKIASETVRKRNLSPIAMNTQPLFSDGDLGPENEVSDVRPQGGQMISKTQKADGCRPETKDHSGGLWGRPMSSSGLPQAEMMTQPQTLETAACNCMKDSPIVAQANELPTQDQNCKDPQPSTSELVRPSSFEPNASEHGLEGDSEQVMFTTKVNTDQPDDYDDLLRNRISALERDIDDAHDGLLSRHIDFNWDRNYDTFNGFQEKFTGPTPGSVKDYATPYDAFVDIWDDNIMRRIVVDTNRYASQAIADSKKKTKRSQRWIATSVSELYAFFGMIIRIGNDTNVMIKGYWTDPRCKSVKNAISYSRYALLHKFLHFVDNSTLQPPPAQTSGPQQRLDALNLRLKKLQPIIEFLNMKFKSLYNLHTNISIEDSLLVCKGVLIGFQVIRHKAVDGIKSYELCEVSTGYLYRFTIYTAFYSTVAVPSVNANVFAGANDLGRKSTKIVEELMNGLWDRGHCLKVDKFLNTPALARYVKLRGTDCLGFLRSPFRRHVPLSIREASNESRGTLVSAYSRDVSITSWKHYKRVILISTFHCDSALMGEIDGEPGEEPLVARDWDSRMGKAIELQKRSFYPYERPTTMKWYIKMFKRLLIASEHNAWIMFNSSRQRRDLPIMSRDQFRTELANDLIE